MTSGNAKEPVRHSRDDMTTKLARVQAVNAYAGDTDEVVIAFMRGDEWESRLLSHDQAVQLADQLRLLTRTTD